MSSATRFWLWRLPALTGSLAILLFGAGFVIALRGSAGRPLGSPPPPPVAAPLARRTGERLVLVLGDSLARGTGDETGRGYARDVLDLVGRRGKARLVNLAVNGAESGDVLAVVRAPNVGAVAAAADLILISAGGNDLSHAAPRSDSNPAAALEALAAARGRFAANLLAILRLLREANPSAPIVLLGLYDPFGEAAARGRVGASIVAGWNSVAQETALTLPNVHLVPTFDLFEGRPDRLSPDRFHPNRSGYQAIAIRIGQVLPASL